ncbi:AEC family transporter [Paenibacillus aestuarii]|uniref:AEC family transporter n=1 Tax=Paenibacillus aestuarii TaxID=516965 RepID=A0ABW0K7G6_9BACL|nr:AEC family transporter [Paenibacillus aestuarii]
MEKLLVPLGILVIGLLFGKMLRRLWENKVIFGSAPLDLFLKKTIQWVLLIVSPFIITGAFWTVKLDSLKLIELPVLGVLTLVIGGLLAVGVSKFQKLDRAKTGSMFVSGSFTNMGNFGTFFCFVFIGENSLPYIALFRLLEEFLYYSVGFPIAKSFGDKERIEGDKSPLRYLTSNPFILISSLAIVWGCLLNMSGMERPAIYGTMISYMVPLSTFLIVIPIGFNINFTALRSYIKECYSISLVKFVAVPLIITALGYVLGIGQIHDNMVLKVMLILSAMPPAFTSLVPPQLYKLDTDLANSSWLFNSGMLILVAPILYLVLQSI